MATSTAQQIITDALKELQVISEDETPTTTMLNDGLRMLNRILDRLSNNPAFAYCMTTVTKTLAGETSFTIGPTGSVTANRPVDIDGAFAVLNGMSYPVRVIDREQYDSISYKGMTSNLPGMLFYDGTYPNGTIYLYPISTGATLTLRLVDQVKSFASLSTQIDLPQGYEDFLITGLAIRMAPSYGVKVTQDTRIAYKAAKDAVYTTNNRVPTLNLPGIMNGQVSTLADFLSGG